MFEENTYMRSPKSLKKRKIPKYFKKPNLLTTSKYFEKQDISLSALQSPSEPFAVKQLTKEEIMNKFTIKFHDE